MSVMSRTRSLESGRFTIVADARISEALLQRVADHLTAEDSRPDKFLKTGSVVAQVVVLYAGRTFFTLVSIPEWVSGVFDGKIRIAVDPFAPSNPALDSVLTHELTHAAVRELSRDRAPGWLQEGLAQWREGRRLTRHDLQRLFSGRALIPLADLETRFARADLEAARTSYAEALGLVEFLLAERGEGAIRCVLTDLAGGAAIDSALSAETGWNAAALLDVWARWAAIQGPQPATAR